MTGQDDVTAGALTAERLTAALRGSAALEAGVAVSGVTATPVGTGQMASCIRLGLTYDGETTAPASVVAKVPASDPQSRGAGAAGAYETEVCFYRDLANGLAIRTPRCFHAELDAPTGEFLLLLEDMAGSEQGDQLAGCTPAEAEVALFELAGLHGPTWGATHLQDQHPWLVRQMVGTGGVGMGAIMQQFVPAFAQRYDGRLDADVVAWATRITEKLESYYARSQAQSVTHGDYRLDNLLFGRADGAPPVAVVDWQTHFWGDPMIDVSYFIGAGLVPEDRRVHERDLVEGYRAALGGHGVELGADEAWERYRLHAIAGWHMAVFASMVVVQTERGDEMFCAMANRHARQALDLDTEALLG